MAISSRYTRGIKIQIGGNAIKLETALDSANHSIRTAQSELDTLKNSLRLEWGATKFQHARALAQKALSGTEARAELLRRALAAMDGPASFSAAQKEQYEVLRRELSYVEMSVQWTKAQLEEISKSTGQTKIDQLTSQLEGADAALDATGAKLDSVRSRLEQNWDVRQFSQAQELARRTITQTEAKAELLRQKLAVLEELRTEKTSTEYQWLEKQLVEAEAAAKQTRR